MLTDKGNKQSANAKINAPVQAEEEITPASLKIIHRRDWASALGHQPIGGHHVIKIMTRPLNILMFCKNIYYFAGRDADA